MSPSSREINGSRPAPLKIHKDTQLIHKQSSSSTATTHHRHHPVIIYTHSPKIIHTQARDFMALVQKLTGLSRSTDDDDDDSAAAANNPPPAPSNIPCKDADTIHAANNDPSPLSENRSIAGEVVHHVGCSPLPSAPAAMSPLGFDPLPPPNPFLSEIPLFTPSSSDFFCSSGSFYRYPESALFSQSIPNMGGSISPSIMDTMKAFPDY
ncbi:VQ motif-containing protein 20-like [Phoenix dactylifera]|uniref:VQ motif-containing protein 20-like n=1 Tax=Phoenix dactylifera TaxID=42345 RepID=A0A8B8JBP6_PHODC|nr:VQ motif-containing protein 20-like [Phoenix dactylifera]